MAVYPTKTHKINNKNRKLKAGITLTTVFSLVLLLLLFNFFEILTIFITGAIGLIIYPLCVFFIILGIMLMVNKEIKTTKTITTFAILWLCVFVLILQMATSKNIDSGFANYISTTFKENLTAGGVLFGTILYPIYYLTYDVATYIILSIVLVIFTSILIDKIYVDIRNKKLINNTNIVNNVSANAFELEEDNFDEEIAIDSTSIPKSYDDENIFIADEDDREQISQAKSILGLSKDKMNFASNSESEDYAEKLGKHINELNSTLIEDNLDNKKPNIFVHEDDITTIENILKKPNLDVTKEDEKKKIDDERRSAALAYLNISKGKFEAKTNKLSSIDNVVPVNDEPTNLSNQTRDNFNRLSNLSEKFNAMQNNQSQLTSGTNPFKSVNIQSAPKFDQNNINDIYDEKFTKKEFNNNFEKYSQTNNSLNNTFNNLTKMAQKVYSGDTKQNLVDVEGFRPVQVSMNEPVMRNRPAQKVYKKPPTYVKPPIDLLKKYSSSVDADLDYINEKGQLIVDTLKAFRIDTKIINAIRGPTFTRYELQMAPGISVNSVNNKINDLSMALESTCRVQVPIPGKNAFGIEVPNKNRVTVGLREMLESQNFQSSKSPLTFALGKDISGDCKVGCIDKLVHTLVAGSTGSGKSVCLNTLLISLLYKASPEDLRLILVDPKTVEFSMFNNLPHLLIPNTITDCEKAVSALSWLVDEMERRYKRLNQLGVKKISEYNETSEVISGSVPKMYYIVMVFDEVGDFMTRAKKEIEEKIMLLAAKSRACGIHLILATQRPTVDVITGTIKANLPSRISFAVNSYNDSKTILESSGAEYLLGYGDMLYLPQGSNDMSRIQGCFIDNNELKSIINFIKENNECDYDEEIEDQMFNKKDGFDPTNGVDDAFDPLMKDCLRYFIKAKKASASSLQAYFGIGYPKANKIVLQMEKAGFVSPGDNNGRRTLYITPQEFEERFGEDLDE